MASSSTSLSLSFPSSSLSRNWEHHVFPSFHGPDVRKAFLSHFLKEFKSKGINPFIDNNIKRGESIAPELKRAIQGSKIAIVLLSKNYSSSSWCLDELVEIMSNKELGQPVLTIFYDVDPTDVKKQSGDFGKVFKKTCKGKTKEKIKTWRKVLEGVATIAGYHSRNWDTEAEMIETIANDVSNMLNNSVLSSDFDGLVGMRAHTEKMEPLLCLNSDEVRMIGIWGPPGIGKSTIARVIYNQLSNNFQLSVFMENIKANYARVPCSDDYSAKLQFQQQLMSQITNQKDMKILRLGVVQDRLKDKKVLVVLDDVDWSVQLDAMAEKTSWFGPGSRIIVTTQDRRLLRVHGIKDIYKVNFPTKGEALEIFCMHAFGQNTPRNGFSELAWEVARLAGELPLGLRIMGSYFRGMSKREWENALPRLRIRLDGEIENILKFSYDALCEEDKDLFRHIACFFNYHYMEKVEEYLGESFMDVRQGLHVLVEKSLISIDEHDGLIKMHSLLVQMGRDIVRKQSARKRQFLVDAKDICEASNDYKTETTRNVKGIEFMINTNNINERVFEGMSNLQFLRGNGDFGHPNMMNYISPKLRLLDWNNCPMTYLPTNINLEFLVELSMTYSMLEKLWDGIKLLQNLKWMDLSFSKNLKELPNLSTATSLQKLDLKRCSSLLKLPSSIGNATNLKSLDLTHCSSILTLPSSIGNATKLQSLKLIGCSSLVELPSSIGNATNLNILDLSGCSALVELPSSIGNATSLNILDLSGCSSLVELPSSIGNATNLKYLDLKDCLSLLTLPSSIGNGTDLYSLDLSRCSSLVELPSSIGNATNLENMYLNDCSSLLTLPSSIGNATNLKLLYLSGCSSLVELPSSIGNATNLQSLDISECSCLLKLPSSIGNATNLQFLKLSGCLSLVSLPPLPDSLVFLDADNCGLLERLDCSFRNPDIHLNFVNCFKLNQEARDLIIQTPTNQHAVLPGGEVPAYFIHRATNGGYLKIKLNEKNLLTTSMRFKACIMFVKGDDESGDSEVRVDYLDVRCNESRHFLYPIVTEHLYIIDVEMEVTSSEVVFEFKVDDREDWKIGECGVIQILE